MLFRSVLVSGARRRAFGGAASLLAGCLMEAVLSALIAPIAMVTRSVSVVSILAGRDGGWAPQSRDGAAIPLRIIAAAYAPHTAIGLSLAFSGWLISASLFFWMLPVTIGLSFAIPLVACTGLRSWGDKTRAAGILQVPDEVCSPAVLSRVNALRGIG